jgi:hypothetical protein
MQLVVGAVERVGEVLREADSEGASLIGAAGDVDLGRVRVDDPLRDGKTEAETSGVAFADRIGAIEAIKDPSCSTSSVPRPTAPFYDAQQLNYLYEGLSIFTAPYLELGNNAAPVSVPSQRAPTPRLPQPTSAMPTHRIIPPAATFSSTQ